MTKPCNVAVIGGGPAAFGALARLMQLKQDGVDVDVTVFSSGDADQETQVQAAYQERYRAQDINAFIKRGKAQGLAGVLPPRSFHGQALRAHVGKGGLKTDVKISDSFGGIGNYWSASVFPTHRFGDPMEAKLGPLDEHYRFIAGQIPISGPGDDALSHFFDNSTTNRPAIAVADDLAALTGRQDNMDGGAMDFAVAVNRFAVNTRADEKNGCVQCGDCMYGCPRDALFRAAKPIFEFARQGRCRVVYEPVIGLKREGERVLLSTVNGPHVFDKAFIAAGALGSINLLGRSYGAPKRTIELFDNLLWYFPALSLWPKHMRGRERVFAFAELAGGIFDHATQTYNHLLVSTFPDAVLDNVLGRNGLSQWLTRGLARHAIIGAMYGSHEEFVRYRMARVGDAWLAQSMDQSVPTMDAAKFALFKRHLAKHGWYCHPRLTMQNGTSGHYTANLGTAYGNESLARDGVFDYNVFVCDSSSWNTASMSQQHTFTIMANAARIVQTAFS